MKRLCALTLLILAALSCSPPPFNLSITQTALTAEHMTLLGQVGPIQNIGSNQGNATLIFYPEKDPVAGITLQAGFVAWAQGSSQQVAFVASGRVVAGSQSLGPNNLAPPFPGFTIQSLKNGHTSVAFSWDSSVTSRFKYVLMTGDPVGNTFTLPPWTDLSGFFSAAPFFIPPGSSFIRDVSISPSPNPGYDYAYMLVRHINGGVNPFQEAQFQISQAGLILPGVALRSAELDLLSVIPTLPTHALYYYDPATTMGFANWYDAPSSSWVCWKWYESSPGVPSARQLSGITHRIDALLSTGELFSTEGDVGRVYDQNGNQTAQFSLTGLAFVEETYVGGVAQVIFSQALWYNNSLHFSVYSIPTAKLKSLGQ